MVIKALIILDEVLTPHFPQRLQRPHRLVGRLGRAAEPVRFTDERMLAELIAAVLRRYNAGMR